MRKVIPIYIPQPCRNAPGQSGSRLGYRSVRLERLPSSGGIVPLNWLFSRDSTVRLERLPSSGRDHSAQLIVAEDQDFQVGEIAPVLSGIDPLNWSNAEQKVFAGWRGGPALAGSFQLNWLMPKTISSVQLGEAAQLWRDRPGQLIVV